MQSTDGAGVTAKALVPVKQTPSTYRRINDALTILTGLLAIILVVKNTLLGTGILTIETAKKCWNAVFLLFGFVNTKKRFGCSVESNLLMLHVRWFRSVESVRWWKSNSSSSHVSPTPFPFDKFYFWANICYFGPESSDQVRLQLSGGCGLVLLMVFASVSWVMWTGVASRMLSPLKEHMSAHDTPPWKGRNLFFEWLEVMSMPGSSRVPRFVFPGGILGCLGMQKHLFTPKETVPPHLARREDDPFFQIKQVSFKKWMKTSAFRLY